MPFQKHLRGGEAGRYSGATRGELFFESSAPLWTRKWNLPHNLKSQLCFSCYSLEGTWWELDDMGPGSPGKSACPLGLSQSPQISQTPGLRLEQNTPQGSHQPMPHSILFSKGGVIWGKVALGYILESIIDKKMFLFLSGDT